MIKLISFALETVDIVVIVVGVVIAVAGVVGATLSVIKTIKTARANAQVKPPKPQQVEISADELLEEMEQQDEYFVLVKNVIYRIGKKGHLPAGDYVAKGTDNSKQVSIRLNDKLLVLEDSQVTTLSEGDTICCMQATLIKLA